MTASWMVRSFAGALLAVCVGVFALPGCGSSPTPPEKKDEKKDDTKPKTDSKSDPNAKPPDTQPPKTTLNDIEPDASKAATKFFTDLVSGTAKADSLSNSFTRVVGKPLLFPDDKSKGFSVDSANSWLGKIGENVAFNPPLYQKQAGDVVYIRGAAGGARFAKTPTKMGEFSLRLLKEGGAWKVDWLAISSAELDTLIPATTPDSAAQEFALVAFVEAITDDTGKPEPESLERTALIAAGLIPPLRKAWGEPFEDDTKMGYDYNRSKMHRSAVNIGGGTSKFKVTRVNDSPEYKVELTKPTGKKTYTLKLVKGDGPYEWLVSEVAEQKG